METAKRMTQEFQHQFWWEMLPAAPCDKDSHAYRWLQRTWFDHTWNNHPFLSPHHENHLTATLFENFVLFEPSDWLPALLDTAGISVPAGRFSECSWGYEVAGWLGERARRFDQKTNKVADVAVHAHGPDGDCAILVEAKVKRGSLRKTDANPDSYLELEAFRDFESRYLIYLVDRQDTAKTRALITDSKARSGLLTWQDLGGLQIELALKLDCDFRIRNFVAGAIQYQYLNHHIRPTRLVAEYLLREPCRDDINKTNPEKMTSWVTRWRIE